MQEDFYPKLEPIKKVVPDWYKKAERFIGGKFNPDELNFNVKSCMPFLDTYLTGYYVPCPVDLWVTYENDVVDIKFRKNLHGPRSTPINVRGPESTPGMQAPPGFYDRHFTWLTKFTIKSPKGYSLLITQPLNRTDLPTYTLSGIVDAENAMYGGNIPFFVKKGFTGLIPEGTPIMQIIPIKRESWKLVENNDVSKEGLYIENKSTASMGGFYKKNLWKKKDYQ